MPTGAQIWAFLRGAPAWACAWAWHWDDRHGRIRWSTGPTRLGCDERLSGWRASVPDCHGREDDSDRDECAHESAHPPASVDHAVRRSRRGGGMSPAGDPGWASTAARFEKRGRRTRAPVSSHDAARDASLRIVRSASQMANDGEMARWDGEMARRWIANEREWEARTLGVGPATRP